MPQICLDLRGGRLQATILLIPTGINTLPSTGNRCDASLPPTQRFNDVRIPFPYVCVMDPLAQI
jgi:hypothetical protein